MAPQRSAAPRGARRSVWIACILLAAAAAGAPLAAAQGTNSSSTNSSNSSSSPDSPWDEITAGDSSPAPQQQQQQQQPPGNGTKPGSLPAAAVATRPPHGPGGGGVTRGAGGVEYYYSDAGGAQDGGGGGGGNGSHASGGGGGGGGGGDYSYDDPTKRQQPPAPNAKPPAPNAKPPQNARNAQAPAAQNARNAKPAAAAPNARNAKASPWPSPSPPPRPGPPPSLLTFEGREVKTPRAEDMPSYAGLAWTGTQIFNARLAVGENLVAAVRSQPNGLDFIPGNGEISVAVPKGSDRVFGPYSAWFTYVEDYNYPDRDVMRLALTGYDKDGKATAQASSLLFAGKPQKVEFPASFRDGIKRLVISPEPLTPPPKGGDPPQIEFAMDDFTVMLPFVPGATFAASPVVTPSAAANGSSQYAAIPYVKDYYDYCDDKARADTPECLRHWCGKYENSQAPKCDAFFKYCEAAGWPAPQCTPPCESLASPDSRERCGLGKGPAPLLGRTGSGSSGAKAEPGGKTKPGGGAAKAGAAKPGAPAKANATKAGQPGKGGAPKASPPPAAKPKPQAAAHKANAATHANATAAPDAAAAAAEGAAAAPGNGTAEGNATAAANGTAGANGTEASGAAAGAGAAGADATAADANATAAAANATGAGGGADGNATSPGEPARDSAPAGNGTEGGGNGTAAAVVAGGAGSEPAFLPIAVGDRLVPIDGRDPVPSPAPGNASANASSNSSANGTDAGPGAPGAVALTPVALPAAPVAPGQVAAAPAEGPPAAPLFPPLPLPPNGRLLTFDDVTLDNATGRAPLTSYGGLAFSGATAASAAALPPALRAGAVSAPAALVNTPALPGLGDASIAFAAAPPAPASASAANASANATASGAAVSNTPSVEATFTPLSMVLTQAPDPALSDALGLPRPSEGRVVVACFAPSGALLAAGTVRLAAGVPGRVAFPPACANSARVSVAPASAAVSLVLDDLAVASGPARRRRKLRLRRELLGLRPRLRRAAPP